MPRFSSVSLARLSTCHPDLQRIAHEAIKRLDFAVLCGHRGKDEQHAAFATGHSKVDWPDSKHNHLPALAMDLSPYPIDWTDVGRFHVLAEVVLEVAAELGIGLRWGGHFKGLVDLPHFELVAV